MRTVAQDTASQTTLRNCSKEIKRWGGVVSIYIYDLVKKGYMQSSTRLSRKLLPFRRSRSLH